MPQGWILFDEAASSVASEAYEVGRLIEVGPKYGLEISCVNSDHIDLVVDRAGKDRILLRNRSSELPDFLVPRKGAGTDYWDLAIIRELESNGVRVFNDSRSIETVKDKLHTQQLLAASDLPTPKTILYKDYADLELVERHLGFPVIVKTLAGTQGAGVCLVRDAEGLNDLFRFAQAAGVTSPTILQQFIADSRGRDLRVIVVGGKPIACMERASSSPEEFKSNISQGGVGIAWEVDDQIGKLATETARLVGLEIAGIDLLFAGDSYSVCEANSSPGFKGMEEFTNVDVAGAICQYIADNV